MAPEVEVHEVPNQEPNHSKGSPPIVVSWNPDVQLQANTPHLVAPGGGSADSTSDVNDLGDGKRLEERLSQGQSHQPVLRKRSNGELVANTGARFEDSEVRGPLSSVDVPVNPNIPPTRTTSDDNTGDTLGITIRQAFRERWEGDRAFFLPINELERIITHGLVSQELLKWGAVSSTDPDELNRVTCQIMDPQKRSKNLTTRRKIFAILALVGRVKTIKDFIDEGIYDSHLPFTHSRMRDRWEGKDEHGKDIPIDVFRSWKMHQSENFETHQWSIIPPIFKLSTNDEPRVEHYKLAEGAILPYIEKPQRLGRGGGGFVEKVKIHPHHLTPSSAAQAKEAYYAVKQLEGSGDGAFKKEVSNLNRFTEKEHPHLIRLLCTFSVGDKHHLLFPCADGNLQELWETHSEPQASEQDPNRAVWLSSQCLGIVQGLLRIHQHESDTLIPGRGSEMAKNRGRHGDLKPENILWFKYHRKEGMGLLKISDFGLMRFHETFSAYRVDAKGIAVSPTYRAPEYDITKEVSLAYDIWSLGCVLLEFITWYLKGWEGVDRFSVARMEEDRHPVAQEDIFFNYAEKDGSRGQHVGSKKNSVREEFADLYAHPDCSDYIHDLLWFTEYRLLRIQPGNRAKCREVYERFEELHRSCTDPKDGANYCLKHTKRPPHRVGTDNSELFASSSSLHTTVLRKSIKTPSKQSQTRRAESPLRPKHLPDETEDGNRDVDGRMSKYYGDEHHKNGTSPAKTSFEPHDTAVQVPQTTSHGPVMVNQKIPKLPPDHPSDPDASPDISPPPPPATLQVPHPSRTPSSSVTSMSQDAHAQGTDEKHQPSPQARPRDQVKLVRMSNDRKNTMRRRCNNAVRRLLCGLGQRAT